MNKVDILDICDYYVDMSKFIFLFIMLFTIPSLAETKNSENKQNTQQVSLSSCNNSVKIDWKNNNMLKSH